MIKFIDINNGLVFDGSSYVKTATCKKCGNKVSINYYDKNIETCQSLINGKICEEKLQYTITGPHHIFWFDKGQSTGIYNIKEICILTDSNHGRIHPVTKKHILPISIKDNNIFKLVNTNNLIINDDVVHEEVINGFNYINIDDLTNTNDIWIEGEAYGEYYVHMLYIVAKTDAFGEFLEDIYIDNIPYTIGADFYEENESLYINLSNFGFDITSDVQKALYPSNVHEDYTDNILINRKLKELLINFWNIIANKGSHKSLINSLNWFEWGDLVKAKDIWKHDIGNKNILSNREFHTVLIDEYKNSLSHFSKTTYMGLYTALEKFIYNGDKILYDDEKNPKLEFISAKWSFNDLSLKMSVLGKFYEMFFMPIHLDLIHSTVEDIVFSNTIKINQSLKNDRTDFVYNFGQVEHNVTDEVYYLNTIEAPIPNSSQVAILWDNYEYDVLDDTGEESDVYYNGLGVSIPVIMKIPVSDNGEFVKSTIVTLNVGKKDSIKDTWNTYRFDRHMKNKVGNNIEIKFNLICCNEFDYDIRFQYELTNSKVYTTNLKFKTANVDNIGLNLYKFRKKEDLKPSDFGAVYIDIDHIEDDYRLIRDSERFNGQPQYVQVQESNNIGMNHVIVLEGDYADNKDDFFTYYHRVLYKNKDKQYTVCISKDFGFEPMEIPQFLLEVMYSNGYRYFSEFYDMKELNGNKFEDFIITDEESLCVTMNLKFGKYIKDYEWIFKNLSTGVYYYPIMNIYSPFITHENINTIDPGFYDIIFKYELYDGTKQEFKLNSAFYKK